MITNTNNIKYIIPFTPRKKLEQKHYIKATILDNNKADDKLDITMSDELKKFFAFLNIKHLSDK